MFRNLNGEELFCLQSMMIDGMLNSGKDVEVFNDCAEVYTDVHRQQDDNSIAKLWLTAKLAS